MLDVASREIEVAGSVKWYDPVKGYGFVTVNPDQGESITGDALLHVTVLQKIHRQDIRDGALVTCLVYRLDGRLRVKEMLDVDESALPKIETPAPERLPAHLSDFVIARFKWFDGVKGYGFVSRGVETEDILVHIKRMKACGLKEEEVEAGKAVLVRFYRGDRGLLAWEIRRIQI